MATARLVYETSENLDARTLAHTALSGTTSDLVVSNDLIAAVGSYGVTLLGLDGVVRWTAPLDKWVVTVALIGDELFVAGHETIDVWSVAGEHRSIEIGLEWEVTHIAFDEIGGQAVFVSDEAEAAIFDLASGEKVLQWDMTEDYDFGSWVDINDVLFRDGRMVFAIGQTLSVWIDGELEYSEWRRGKNLGQYSNEFWSLSERYLTEVSSENRGLVIYDATTLEMLAQPGATGDFAVTIGENVMAWSDQHVSVWDGDAMTFYKPDWRGHHLPRFTPDGLHAVSISLRGEVCVQRVVDFQELGAEPPRVWAQESITAFATNPAGTHAAVVRGVQNAMARVDMIDLTAGTRRELGKMQPTETLHFLDDARLFGVTGRWVEPTAVSTWAVSDDAVQTLDVSGAYLGAGKGWVATKEGETTVVFWSLEGEQLQEMSRYEAPEGFELQSVDKRWADAWDEDYNSVLLDLETGHSFPVDEGILGGELLALTEWDDGTTLRVCELPTGNEIGEWKGDVSDYLVSSGRKVFFSDINGALFGWVPPDAPVELFAAEDLGTIKWSDDQRHIVSEGAVVRVWDVDAPNPPLAELRLPSATTRAEMAGDYLVVAGTHGMYSIYAIESTRTK